MSSPKVIRRSTRSVPRAWLCKFAALLVFIAGFVLNISLSQADESPDKTSQLKVGEQIYLKGILGSGKLLQGMRGGGLHLTGETVACVNCHERSGLGSTEGQIYVPPITLRYLFFDPKHPSQADLDLPYVEGMRITRKPYTRATLAKAIREGTSANGRSLDYMMPRFPLKDSDMQALIAYLGQLDKHNTRGVTHTVLHFATIITPDADPIKRKGMLAVLRRFFGDKNMAPVLYTPRMRSSRKFKFWVNPMWKLHVWQLHGPANTWKAQLKSDITQQPVFAVISGLAGSNWQPVHEFCEEQKLPCLFPNVEVPPEHANRDFYSLYFSRGVLLEADLIGNRIHALNQLAKGGARIKQVNQIYRTGDSGVAAAHELGEALKQQGIQVHDFVLPHVKAGHGFQGVLRKAVHGDAVVLWLRAPDIAKLGPFPGHKVSIFMSGLMGGLDATPLPAAWRSSVHMVYPVGLPQERRISVDFALGWFRIRHIPIVSERVQANTYLACGVLSSTLHQMVDSFVPEYLMEKLEGMLDNRLITGYFPHLTLAPDQRFASKGGYIVHFKSPHGQRVVAEDAWVVPQSISRLALDH